MKLFGQLALAAIFVATAGCHAQVPPTNSVVVITISPPSSCTASTPCSYDVSRATATGTSCPATTGTTYILMNSTPMTALSYTDASVAGQTACYIAQSVQGGGISGPSNTAGPITAPPNPIAPVISGSAQASANDAPLRPSPMATMARNSAPQITVVVR